MLFEFYAFEFLRPLDKKSVQIVVLRNYTCGKYGKIN